MPLDAHLEVRSDTLGELVRLCRLMSTRLETTAPSRLLWEVRQTAVQFPTTGDTLECLLVRQLIVNVVRALMARAGRSCDVALGRRLEALSNACLPPTVDWRANLLDVLDQCCRLLRVSAVSPASLSAVSVGHILDVLNERFQEPALSLSALANELGLSPWHVVRLLRTYTGEGFVGHVRARRVAEATRLLEQTRLSGKQIAASVGYRQARQLARDFRQVFGTTPTAFRKSLLPQRTLKTIRRFARTGQRSQDLASVFDCATAHPPR